MEMASEEDLVREFSTFGISLGGNLVMEKVMSLCSVHSLTAEDMSLAWISFSATNGAGDPTPKLLDAMEKEVLMKTKSKTPVAAKNVNPVYNVNTIEDISRPLIETVTSPLEQIEARLQLEEIRLAEDDIMDVYCTPEAREARKSQVMPSTPLANKLMSSPSMLNSPLAISSVHHTPGKTLTYSNFGVVVCSYGDCSDVKWKSTEESKYGVSFLDDNVALTERYKYMFDKLSDTASVLDDAINKMAACLKTGLQIDDFAHVRIPLPENVDIVGRVCCDGNGRLNPSSILLESSVGLSNGLSVAVNVSQLAEYSLFSGQIVGMNGINRSGKNFLAHKIYDGVFPPKLPVDLDATEPGCLRVVVAAGPYTQSDSLSLEPLERFLKYVQENEPHVCILIGPFIDSSNKLIQQGVMDFSHDDLFATCLQLISYYTKSLETQIAIVPSTRDVHHDFVYPTPPFSLPQSLKKDSFQRFKFVSDPSMLKIGNLIVGVTANDTLFHLAKEEISCPTAAPDRLKRLVTSLLKQHSFYPLYPPEENLNVCYERLDLHCQISVMPDVLLLPSDLSCFIQNVNGCHCINPRRLIRGTSEGTFAIFSAEMRAGSMQDFIAEVIRL